MPTQRDRFKEFEGQGFYVEAYLENGNIHRRYLYIEGEAMPIATQITISGNARTWAMQKIRARVKSAGHEVNNYEYAVALAQKKLEAWEKLAKDNL